jgi:hypothetical protein
MWSGHTTEVKFATGLGAPDSALSPQWFDDTYVQWKPAGATVQNSHQLSLHLAVADKETNSAQLSMGSFMFKDSFSIVSNSSDSDDSPFAKVLVPVECTLLHNASSSPHALPAFISELSIAETNRLLDEVDGRRGNTFFSTNNYRVTSNPLPLSQCEGVTLEDDAKLSLFAILFLLIPLSMCPATYGVAHAVSERRTKALLVQLMAGLQVPHNHFATCQSLT